MGRSSDDRRVEHFVFPYTVRETRRGRVPLPMVKARLSWGRSHSELGCLMDTGADSCFLPPDVADGLGLEPQGKVTEAFPVGPSFKVRPHRACLEMVTREGKFGHACPIDFLVPEQKNLLEFPILGREPFLRWYELKVRHFDGEFELRLAHRPPQRP